MATKKASTTKKNNWEVTADRYVGFIDIMGFKDMVARMSHQEIYEMMKEIDRVKKENEAIKWNGGEEKLISSTFYSDSIILYSKDATYNSAYYMLCTLSALTEDLLVSGIPHKGALSFGRMTLDNARSIFFGQPLIDAFQLQEELNMYGIILHASVEQELHKQNFEEGLFFEEYNCPFKGGLSSHLTVPPLSAGTAEKKDEEKLIQSLKIFRHRTSGHIRKYVDNTENFIKFLCATKS